MKWIHLLIIALLVSLGSCETIRNKGIRGDKTDNGKPSRLADIDTSDLPEEYVPNIRPVIVYYVDDPSNSQFTFDDAIGDYRVLLFAGHRYRFIATAKDKSKSDSREGLWKWHRIGPDQGFLMLDDRRWFLNFSSLQEATATTNGDNRSFTLKFSNM